MHPPPDQHPGLNALFPKPKALVTFSTVLQFLTSHEVSTTCASCGHQEWTVSIGDSGGPLYALPPLAAGEQFIPSIPIVYVECKKCGYLRLYSYQRIVQWAMTQKSPEQQYGLFGGSGTK